jgi:hypothetical protein
LPQINLEVTMPVTTAGASTDLARLAYIQETTFGVVPNSGNPRAIRFTGESLKYDVTQTQDKEITADGQANGSSTTDAGTSGDIKVHMQYAEYDDFLAAVLRNSWTVYGTKGVGTTFSGTFTTTTLTAAVAPSGSSAFTTLQPGQWFQLNAPGDVNDGKWLRNSSTVAATGTVITLDPSTPLSATGPIANCSISTQRVTAGTVIPSFCIEKQMSDVSQYIMFTGQCASKFSTEFKSESQTEATITFIGKNGLRNASNATALPGTVQPSNTFEIHDGVTSGGRVWENGAPIANTKVKSISLDIDAGLRAQKELNTLGPVGVGVGSIAITGKVTVYFKDGTLYDKYTNGTYTSLTFPTKGPDGNGYVVTLPRVRLSNGQVVAGGKNTDLMAEYDYTAYADRKNSNAALQKVIFIDRLGAAA